MLDTTKNLVDLLGISSLAQAKLNEQFLEHTNHLIEMYNAYKSGEYKQTRAHREATVTVVAPSRPSKYSVVDYFVELGYEAEMFEVWEDEPSGVVCFRPKRFIDSDDWNDQIRELGAQYDRNNKCYVVNM